MSSWYAQLLRAGREPDRSRHTCAGLVSVRDAVGRASENLPGFGEGRVDGTGSFDANGRPGWWRPSTFSAFSITRTVFSVGETWGFRRKVVFVFSTDPVSTPKAPPTETCGHDSRSGTRSGAAGRPVKQGHRHPISQIRPCVRRGYSRGSPAAKAQ